MRHDNDLYETPHSIIGVLLAQLEGWPSETMIWEPCAGPGRLVVALDAAGFDVISSDITTGDDFFDQHGATITRTIVTNPPFKHIRRFIDHAFSIGAERMALVCPERLWACGKGLEQWARHRPSRFINLSWREDYLERGGSPDRALAISVWDTPHARSCDYEIWGKPNG